MKAKGNQKAKRSVVSGQLSVGGGELLPCPFCGGIAEAAETSVPTRYIIGCTRVACHAAVLSCSVAEGRTKWNLRVEAGL